MGDPAASEAREHLASQTEWRAYDDLAMIAASEMWESNLPGDDRAEIRTIAWRLGECIEIR
jgi:hypothetical protein